MTDEQLINEALQRPGDFGYHGDNEDIFRTWSLGPVIRTRDSTLLENSNADTLIKYLEEQKNLEGEWELITCNHWAIGWVEHLSFRVIDNERDRNPTEIFYILKEWSEKLQDYPVADDSDYSEKQYEATLENIQSEGGYLTKENCPDDWVERVWKWLWDNNQMSLEDHDDQGGYPTDDEIKEALLALNLLDPEYMEDQDD